MQIIKGDHHNNLKEWQETVHTNNGSLASRGDVQLTTALNSKFKILLRGSSRYKASHKTYTS